MIFLTYAETCMKRWERFCIRQIVLFFCWSALKLGALKNVDLGKCVFDG
jgi:hypothetical protein